MFKCKIGLSWVTIQCVHKMVALMQASIALATQITNLANNRLFLVRMLQSQTLTITWYSSYSGVIVGSILRFHLVY